MAPVSNCTCDVLVVGTGPAGFVAAIAMAQAGLDTIAVGPAMDPARDTRTTALFTGSVALLRNLGLGARLEPALVPMTGLRLIDETPRRGVHGLVAFVHPKAANGMMIELLQRDHAESKPEPESKQHDGSH